jgi:ComF family protein
MGPDNIPSLLKSLYTQSLDLLFPSRCVSCRKFGPVWCSDCRSQVELIIKPYCQRCGNPEKSVGACMHCSTWNYNFDEARSWGRYSGQLRKAILNLKHRLNNELGSELAIGMADVLSVQPWKIDLVVPIPLATHRLAERGYNQAEVLARPFAEISNLNFANKVLQRSHETVKQFELDARQRWDNLLGAFRVDSHDLASANILIVDDIMTTGATLNAAAVALKKAGCSKVYALTLAKTLFDEE